MAKLIFRKQVSLGKLTDELIRTGCIRPVQDDGTSSVQGNNEEVWVYIPDNMPQEVIEQITAIVNAHDPTPLPVYEPVDEEKAALAEAIIDLEARLSALEVKLNA